MDFRDGLRKGIPIALGYIPVAFTFGLMAASAGISPWMATLISLTNLTSAGQFAGTNLVIAGAPLLEIAVTTFVINIRYLLMSLSLSQKIITKTSLLKRAIASFGITDEVFAVASLEPGDLSFSYMLGLISYPYFGWAIGTALGASVCSVLPEALQNSMGIALRHVCGPDRSQCQEVQSDADNNDHCRCDQLPLDLGSPEVGVSRVAHYYSSGCSLCNRGAGLP